MTKLAVLMKDGHEEVEALTVVDYLRRAGVEVVMVSFENRLLLTGAHEIHYQADVVYDDVLVDGEMPFADYDGVYVPGGTKGAESIAADARATGLLKKMYDAGKMVSAMCAGPIALQAAGVLKGHNVTSYPSVEEKLTDKASYDTSIVVVDGQIVTSRGPATAIYMALQLTELLQGVGVRKELEKKILLPLVEEAIRTQSV